MMKKPLSAYFYFANDVRKDIIASEPGLSVAQAAKLIGVRWKELSEEERSKYQSIAAKAKEEYAEYISKHSVNESDDKDGNNEGTLDDENENKDENADDDFLSKSRLPLSKIKHLLKLDDRIGTISAEASTVTALATEIFIGFLGSHAFAVTQQNKRKTVSENDVIECIKRQEVFSFLRHDIGTSKRSIVQQLGDGVANVDAGEKEDENEEEDVGPNESVESPNGKSKGSKAKPNPLKEMFARVQQKNEELGIVSRKIEDAEEEIDEVKDVPAPSTTTTSSSSPLKPTSSSGPSSAKKSIKPIQSFFKTLSKEEASIAAANEFAKVQVKVTGKVSKKRLSSSVAASPGEGATSSAAAAGEDEEVEEIVYDDEVDIDLASLRAKTMGTSTLNPKKTRR
jgi:histone H3/H4